MDILINGYLDEYITYEINEAKTFHNLIVFRSNGNSTNYEGSVRHEIGRKIVDLKIEEHECNDT